MFDKVRLHFRSFYVKLVIMFLLIGLLPFLLMGAMVYNIYFNTMYQNVLLNYSKTDELIAENISNLLAEISDATEYVYKSSVANYDYFYELFEDEEISETGRSALITKVLRSILYMNEAIDHVFFVTPDGKQYSSMRAPELLVDSALMKQWAEEHYVPGTETSE